MAILDTIADIIASVVVVCIAWPLGAAAWTTHMMYQALRQAVQICRRQPALGKRSRDLHTAKLEIVDVAGIKTEILSWDAEHTNFRPSGATKPADELLGKVMLVMYPGNPGAVDYYAPFLEQIHALSGRRISIMCVGHASHSSRSAALNGRARLTLQEQVEHKNAIVQRLHDMRPDLKFVLAGHSVGAYMAVETCRHMPLESVLRVVGLFPTLAWIGLSVNGKKLMPLFRFGRQVLWLAAHLVRALPSSVQHALVKWHLPPLADPMVAGVTTRSLIHPEVAYNALHMALHEMREICALDEQHFSSLQSKVRLYLAPNDGWVNDHDIEHISRQFPGTQAHRSPHAEDVHAFVLFPAATSRVAHYVWRAIEDGVLESTGSVPNQALADQGTGGQSRGGGDGEQARDREAKENAAAATAGAERQVAVGAASLRQDQAGQRTGLTPRAQGGRHRAGSQSEPAVKTAQARRAIQKL